MRELYEIWNPKNAGETFPWRAQMFSHVAHFETKEQAEAFVKAIKAKRPYREEVAPEKQEAL